MMSMSMSMSMSMEGGTGQIEVRSSHIIVISYDHHLSPTRRHRLLVGIGGGVLLLYMTYTRTVVFLYDAQYSTAYLYLCSSLPVFIYFCFFS